METYFDHRTDEHNPTFVPKRDVDEDIKEILFRHFEGATQVDIKDGELDVIANEYYTNDHSDFNVQVECVVQKEDKLRFTVTY